MNRYMTIENHGELGLTAIMTFGASTKEGQKKIGQFGTGIKYAIALLMRMGVELVIASGTQVCRFYTKSISVREGTTHNGVFFKCNNVEYSMNMVDDLGKHDWCDNPSQNIPWEWLVCREFYANAVDEGGERIYESIGCAGEFGKTKIYIEETERLRGVLANLHHWIIGTRKPLHSNKVGSVYAKKDGESGRVYNKGIYIRGFRRGLLFDYNFNDMKITESRTADEYEFRARLEELVRESDEFLIGDYMQRVIDAPSCVEAEIEIWHSLPQENFRKAFELTFGAQAVAVPPNVHPYIIETLRVQGYRLVQLPSAWFKMVDRCCCPTYLNKLDKLCGDGIEFVQTVDSKFKNEVIACVAAAKKWFGTEQDIPVRFFKSHPTGETVLARMGCSSETYIGIAVDQKFNDREHLMDTVVEEIGHYLSRATDFSWTFVDYFVSKISKKIVSGMRKGKTL